MKHTQTPGRLRRGRAGGVRGVHWGKEQRTGGTGLGAATQLGTAHAQGQTAPRRLGCSNHQCPGRNNQADPPNKPSKRHSNKKALTPLHHDDLVPLILAAHPLVRRGHKAKGLRARRRTVQGVRCGGRAQGTRRGRRLRPPGCAAAPGGSSSGTGGKRRQHSAAHTQSCSPQPMQLMPPTPPLPRPPRLV